MLCKFYWLIDQPPGRELQKHDDFNLWMRNFAIQWGEFCDTTDSLTPESLQTFIDDPVYRMEDYMPNPSGWLTFNQLFAREIKPGLRPVAGLTNDKVITSPADSVFKEKFPIDDHNEVTMKLTHKYKILDLLEGSPYREEFRNGIFMHAFLGAVRLSPLPGTRTRGRHGMPGHPTKRLPGRPDTGWPVHRTGWRRI